MSFECQIHSLAKIHLPLSRLGVVWQFRTRVKRMVKRRINFALNMIRRTTTMNNSLEKTSEKKADLHVGDRVRIKTKEEIRQTLDNWNEYKGCGFMEEMWPYCGTEQIIIKQVDRFLDERDYRVKQVRGIYLLENMICNGTVDFGPCDRSCFFFWREEWLEKIEAA